MSIEMIENLQKETNTWLSHACSIISLFVKAGGKEYIDYLGNETKRPHTISTASALISSSLNSKLQCPHLPNIEDAIAIFNRAKTKKGYWSSDRELEPNYYEGSYILYALELYKVGSTDDLERHRELMRKYIKSYNPLSHIEPSSKYCQYHPFLLFLTTRALMINELNEKEIHLVNRHFFNELTCQVAFKKAGDEHNYDLIRLGWAICGLLLTKCNWKPQLLEHAKDLFMECQLSTGIWPGSHLVIKMGTENLACSGLQLLFEIIYRSSAKWLLKHLDKIEKLYEWLRSHQIYENSIPLWKADLNSFKPLWFNLLILDILCILDLRFTQIFTLNAISHFSTHSSAISWSDLMDTDLKKTLESKIIKRLNGFSDTRLKYQRSGGKHIADGASEPARSIILFGPPGTSKTTMARALSNELGWSYIEISPIDFCIQGPQNIFLRTREIFDMLFELKKVVILFDEIDELVTIREREQEKIGRFLTTTMLPLFQALHDKKDVIFIVNTNDIERYDPAIRRPGRFDLILPVAPPSTEEQKLFLKRKLHLGNMRTINSFFPNITQPRTISELKNLLDTLSRKNMKEWDRASKIWNLNNLPSIDKKMLNKFEKDKTKYARI